jgi:DNA gyrase subunit A
MSDQTPPPVPPAGDGGTQPPFEFGNVQPIEIQTEMERSFLDYAMSVIVSRALPDVRDGLKPVHRRILWSMQQQGMRPDRNHRKSATVVGDVIGKYHPHGDSAVYDAMVRMAQDFSLRHPLVDGHGNFGAPDASAAAYRYTEARLAPIAMQLLADIEEDTVDLVPNFSGEHEEPTVLPARFPNLLVNGSQGIAVGMATNIPPHNLGEVIDAVLHLLDHPEATVDELMAFVKGPDFPTGALILGKSGIHDYCRTGKGSIRMRAVAEIEELKSGRSQIVVTELPYQASPQGIIERIGELVDSGELVGISDANDASAGDDTTLIIDLKRDANPLVVLNNLFKYTALQSTFSANMVALVDGVPRTLNLRQMLVHYIEHQVDVITRRSQSRLAAAQRRAHILEGRIKALNVIDEVIALIRASEDRPAARNGLMAAPFEFSEMQAEDILAMNLGQLTRLARVDLEKGLQTEKDNITSLSSILNERTVLNEVIRTEISVIRAEFATPRKSIITFDPGDMSTEDLIEDMELVITFSKVGYIKAMPADTFRTQGRGGRGIQGAKLKDEDYVTSIITTSAHAYLLFFSNRGRVYRLKAHEIPVKDRSARGTAIVNLLPLGPEEKIQTIIDTRDYETNQFLFFATKLGQVKKTLFTAYDSSLRAGIIAVNLRDDDELVKVIQCNDGDHILMVSKLGMAIRFDQTEDVRPMGRAAAGVRGMKLKTGDEVVSVDAVSDATDLLMVTNAGYGKRVKVERFSPQGRGGQGVIAIKLPAKKGQVMGAFTVELDDEIILISDGGVTNRQAVREISSQGREATGVRVMTLDAGQSVASVAKVYAAVEE